MATDGWAPLGSGKGGGHFPHGKSQIPLAWVPPLDPWAPMTDYWGEKPSHLRLLTHAEHIPRVRVFLIPIGRSSGPLLSLPHFGGSSRLATSLP